MTHFAIIGLFTGICEWIKWEQVPAAADGGSQGSFPVDSSSPETS